MKLSSFRSAQATMRRRSKRARTLDRRRTRNVTTSVTKWRKAPGRYDIRGIDTRRKKGRRGGSRKRRVGRKPGPKRSIAKKSSYKKRAPAKKRKNPKRVAAGKRLALMRWGSGVVKRYPEGYDHSK